MLAGSVSCSQLHCCQAAAVRMPRCTAGKTATVKSTLVIDRIPPTRREPGRSPFPAPIWQRASGARHRQPRAVRPRQPRAAEHPFPQRLREIRSALHPRRSPSAGLPLRAKTAARPSGRPFTPVQPASAVAGETTRPGATTRAVSTAASNQCPSADGNRRACGCGQPDRGDTARRKAPLRAHPTCRPPCGGRCDAPKRTPNPPAPPTPTIKRCVARVAPT